jgi:protein gp37
MYRDKKRYGVDASVVVKSKPNTFNKPLHWKDPAKVFVCSWSDFFIEEADEWRQEAWDIIRKTPHLTYLILTKRPENIKDRLPEDWGEGWSNVWMGVTAENQEQADRRIPILLQTPAAKRFVSIEPMLGEISLRWLVAWDGMATKPREWQETTNHLDGLRKLDWVICGGESGPNARPMKYGWAWQLMDQCTSAGVPFFYKQGPDDNGVFKKMPELTQIVWDQTPK